ncbi:MAG TPA: NAD(P)/FAD-dependent oxidoreductase [Acidimicrobiales bacterium]|nr:NAD(P)/FAD-dependent oxidoreductase [Acidimicrobiales bacterium]
MTTTPHPDRESYDAVIVGARVAGAATALLLARQGRRVLALDRAAFGSDTPSTHALMKGGVLQLHRWGLLGAVRGAGTPPLRLTKVHYDDSVIEIPMEPEDGVDALYAPRRTVLDPLLATAAREAGAEIRFETSVTGLARAGDGRVVGVGYRTRDGRHVEARAPITIGADGVRSLVARAVAAPVTHAGTGASAVAYAYFEAGRDDGLLWFFRQGAGAGIIPTNGGALAYVALPAGRFATDLRPDAEAGFWRALRRDAPEAAEALAPRARISRFHVHAGTAGFHRRSGGPGWALVGDAAHYKDPISAHGLTDALRDAELLARAIGRGLDEPDGMPAALAAYEAERDRLSRPMFDIVDRVAAYDWTAAEVRDLLIGQSRTMAEEVEMLRALDATATRAA